MRRRDERGTAIVEMALALPVFLVLVLGLFDFGRAVYVRNALGNAARDAARFASVDPNNTACVKSVAGFHDSLANLTSADVTYSPPASARINQPVTVTVQATYRPITPLVAELIGTDSLTLTADATMRVRNVPSGSLACPPPPAATATPTSVPAATSAAITPTATTPTATPPAGTATAQPTATTQATATPRPSATATPVPPTATPTPCTSSPGQCKK